MNHAIKAHLDPMISFVSPGQILDLNPKDIMGLAIPRVGRKVQVAVLGEFKQLFGASGLTISIPEWSSEVTIIESIHVTCDGFVFVCTIGGSPELNELGRKTVEAIVLRMEADRKTGKHKEPVMTFFTAVQQSRNAVSMLYKKDGEKLRYCYTIMGIPNLRVVSNDYLIYSHREEIRKMSLNAIRKGEYLSTDYVCHIRQNVVYLGRPNFDAQPYVPMTLADGRSVKLDLAILNSRFEDRIFSEENLSGTLFRSQVSGVIGKLRQRLNTTAIYGAVQGSNLVLIPEAVA